MSDYCSSDDDDYGNDQGFLYTVPLIVGSMVINGTTDFIAQKTLLFAMLSELGCDADDLEVYEEDLGPDSTLDDADYTVSVIHAITEGSQPAMLVADLSALDHATQHPVAAISDEALDGLDAITAQFSLDSLVPDSGTKLKVDGYIPTGPREINLSIGLGPPRPPNMSGRQVHMESLILSSSISSDALVLKRPGTWRKLLSHILAPHAEFPSEDHFSRESGSDPFRATGTVGSSSSLASLAASMAHVDRANSRPPGASVFVQLSDGAYIDVGVHSYRLQEDIIIPLDSSLSDYALQEYFSAVAGEGLGCATPSHDLHQMVSATLAQAISLANETFIVEVERGRYDVSVDRPSARIGTLDFDITSTSGLWKKPLRKSRMVALSKYDMAAILVYHQDPNVSLAFSLAVSNSLAVEHCSYYGLPDTANMPDDLVAQYEISTRMHRLSHTSVTELSAMSYQAVLAESVASVVGMDESEQGMGYRDKANIILDALADMETPESIAFPPLPLQEIVGFGNATTAITIVGQDFIVPSAGTIPFHTGTIARPHDNRAFLASFPASGLIPYVEACDLASRFQTGAIRVKGLTHSGPCSDAPLDGSVKGLWDIASDLYKSSSIAQFAEIRADLVKSIDTNTPPPPGSWKMVPLYKNKVCCWYSSRDQIADARGYRIDWFAVSAFKVAGCTLISGPAQSPLYLWPRQRMRSQEMELAGALPRRLKLTLFSMLEKARAARATAKEVYQAWQKLGLTAISSTWASGVNYITARHLSSAFSAPSPPFHTIAKKLKSPKTFACVLYLVTLSEALEGWHQRDQYYDRCALLGLPRSFSQLEAYWQVWVPSDLADTSKHMTDCAIALFEEFRELEATASIRHGDIQSQLELVSRNRISIESIRESVRNSTALETGGKFGWSLFGSLAAAHALTLEGDVKTFDREFSRGTVARRLVDHLTVRHSSRITKTRNLETGTVAQMIINQGLDMYLSKLMPTYRFYYGDAPCYFNHPKNGELKDREISQADPDSRIMLNDAELIAGSFGKYTNVDMLKRSDKDAHFYRLSAECMVAGGAIQASDASRFSAMMSNISTGLCMLSLACIGGSAHLLSASTTYRRLAARRMVLSTEILQEISKREEQDRGPKQAELLRSLKSWINAMPTIGSDRQFLLKGYTTSAHTGQGMSHHGTSLMHGGALLISIAAASHAAISIASRPVYVSATAMVTSDDSTIIATVDDSKTKWMMSRQQRQIASRLFLKVQQQTRLVALRLVSVVQNLAKEKVSGVAGEFNSQDNGIGASCPILGFREMICQMVRPSSGNLVSDLLSAHAYGKTCALAGQGLNVGQIAHMLMIDAVESRWRMQPVEKKFLLSLDIIPDALIMGTHQADMLVDPQALLPAPLRGALVQIARDHSMAVNDLNPHSQDTVFGPMMHITVPMRRQHKLAIELMVSRASEMEAAGMVHQARMMKEALGATISSARNRNVGRIGQRIRTRQVAPRTYGDKVFQKAPMMESILSWLAFLNEHVKTVEIGPEAALISARSGARLFVGKSSANRFPLPATRRQSKRPSAKKPVFILEPYGKTPFGKHVVERSQATVVPAIGPEHRALMHDYLSAISHRKIPLHTQYGRKFVTSWSAAESGTIGIRVPETSYEDNITVKTLWGKMDDDAITFLRQVEEENPRVPVLAFNYSYRDTGHFHCLYKGQPYSHSMVFDADETAPGTSLPMRIRGDLSVVLAFQGASTEKTWHGTGPTRRETRNFQMLPNEPYQNSTVEETSQEMERTGTLDVPIMAALVEKDSRKVLYMSSSPMSRDVSDMYLPFERSKMLSQMAMGGYWYTSRKGVCFRAFLKGHTGTQNAWTGAVLGWRSFMCPDPDYIWEPPDTGIVKAIAVVKGIDDDEGISRINTSEYATACFYADREGIHAVDAIINLPLSKELKGIMQKMNGGRLLFNDNGEEALLIDTMLPVFSQEPSALTLDACISRLEALAKRNANMYDVL